MTVVRFAMAGPGGVGAMARLARVGRVFIRQQPAGEIKLVGGGFYRDSSGRFVPNPVRRVDTRNFNDLKDFEFPYGPKEITYEGSTLDYQEIQRPGLKPVLKSIAPKLRRLALSAALADKSSHGVDSVEEKIWILESMAQDDLDLSFVHGGVHLGYLVRLTSMTITSLERTYNGEITRAMVDLNFQESSALNVNVVNLEAVTSEPTTPDEVPEEDVDPLEMPDMDAIATAIFPTVVKKVELTPPTGTGPGLTSIFPPAED